MQFRWLFGLVLTICFIRAWTQPDPRMTTEDYIQKHKAFAIHEMHRTRIPASITLAQGILESGSGNSRLTKEGNNHFGIKCKGSWTGKTLFEDDDEKQECFRAYDSAWQSYRDHSDFLLKNSRYAFLFDLEPTDYQGWAHGLKKAGYATNPAYAQLLITQIEKYQLQQYDLSSPDELDKTEKIKEKNLAQDRLIDWNGMPALIVREDDSWQSIALEQEMRVWQLLKYNDLPDTAQLKSRDTIYIKPKRNRPEAEKHLVKKGETMHILSQRYGVKLRKLMDRNLLESGQEPEIGEYIFLKEHRTSPPQIRSLAPAIKVGMNVQTSSTKTLPTLKEYYEINKGDNQDSVCLKTGLNWTCITSQNEWNGEFWKPGTRLKIKPCANIPSCQMHKVQQGETVYRISKKYNVEMEKLIELNGIKNNQLYPGQVLKIP